MDELSGNNVEEVLVEEVSAETPLTYAKLQLQWIVNKAKANKDIDYFDRILFEKFKLEKILGKKVKLNIKR